MKVRGWVGAFFGLLLGLLLIQELRSAFWLNRGALELMRFYMTSSLSTSDRLAVLGQAEVAYQKAAKASVDRQQIDYHLGQIASAQGQMQQAQRYWAYLRDPAWQRLAKMQPLLVMDAVQIETDDFALVKGDKKHLTTQLLDNHKILTLYTSGVIVGEYLLAWRDGRYSFTLRAIHDQPGPVEIGLGVDEAAPVMLIFGRDDNSWGEEQITLNLTSGFHKIELSFLNDAYTDQGDRNASLDWLKVEYIGPSR